MRAAQADADGLDEHDECIAQRALACVALEALAPESA
jgi:hypothetical protein